jgi:hypothetical protein
VPAGTIDPSGHVVCGGGCGGGGGGGAGGGGQGWSAATCDPSGQVCIFGVVAHAPSTAVAAAIIKNLFISGPPFWQCPCANEVVASAFHRFGNGLFPKPHRYDQFRLRLGDVDRTVHSVAMQYLVLTIR